jgi:hypothetical protein
MGDSGDGQLDRRGSGTAAMGYGDGRQPPIDGQGAAREGRSRDAGYSDPR